MRENQTTEQSLSAIKNQLANLAYDIFNIQLARTQHVAPIPYSQLAFEFKMAWMEATWSAVEASKNKNMTLTDSISKKEQDNGYLLYAGCKEIKKKHSNLVTYSKFPEEVKEMYRNLAKTLYEKMDNEEE
jgi:hypothetical protein